MNRGDKIQENYLNVFHLTALEVSFVDFVANNPGTIPSSTDVSNKPAGGKRDRMEYNAALTEEDMHEDLKAALCDCDVETTALYSSGWGAVARTLRA